MNFYGSVCMDKLIKILTWDDYPESYSSIKRGKYCVTVAIPRQIRHLFGNAPVRPKVAGPTEADFHRLRRSLTHKIYQEFDKRQAQAAEKRKAFDKLMQKEWFENNEQRTEDKINLALQKMLATFPHVVPKGSSYNYFSQVDSDKYPSLKNLNTTKPLTQVVPYNDLLQLKNQMDAMANMVWSDPTRFTKNEAKTAQNYLQPAVRSYFEDLLVLTAKKQKFPMPDFPDPALSDFWFWNETDELDMSARPRKAEVLKMSSVRDEYFLWVEKYYAAKDTRNKLKLGFNEFLHYMGDLRLDSIDSAMAVRFAEAQCDDHANRSLVTIKNRNWAMNTFCNEFCIPKRYMSFKPFYGVSLKRYGTKGGKWLEYTDEDLDVIFGYSWEKQELLLLQMALATGMRLGELALLTWERIKSVNKCSYISLLDEGDEIISIKNEGSKRRIPIHPALKLPLRGSGRIFNYAIDGYGKASTSAGRAVNQTLRQLIGQDRKTFHSFRSSFIIKLTKVGTPKEIHKLITGHGAGDVNTDVYSGVSVEDRFEWLRKIELRWLN